MNKQVWIVSGVIIGVIVLWIGLAGVVLLINGTEQVTVTKTEVPKDIPEQESVGDTQVTLKSDDYNDYVSGAKKIYVDSCKGNSPDLDSYCGCTYDWLNDNLTNDEFYDVTIEALEDKIPDEMYEAAKACT